MYQTARCEIKEGHDMYHYCRQACRSFKNMYNMTNFYIRQLLAGFKKDEPVRTPNERDAVRDVTQMLEQRNRILGTVSGKYGISVQQQEESYTSKADFLCRDKIPVYKEEGSSRPVFSGKRGRLHGQCGCLELQGFLSAAEKRRTGRHSP